MTFNLATGVDEPSWVDRGLAPHVAEINERDPDIVVAQEVDRDTERANRVDQVEILTTSTQLKYYVFHGQDYPDGSGGEYGTVVLSRYPLRALSGLTITSTLPRFSQENPRLLNARTDTAVAALRVWGTDVRFCSAHWPHNIGNDPYEPNRAWHQLQVADAYLRMYRDAPMDTVIGGDFNADHVWPSTIRLQTIFRDAVSTLPAGALNEEEPAPDTPKELDRIFFRGRNLYVTDAWVLDNVRDGRQFSDHPLVLATLVVEPAVEGLFRAVSDWCAQSNGTHGAGWPVTDALLDAGPLSFEAGLLRSRVVTFKDVDFADLQPGYDTRSRLTAAHDFARANGYDTGFPNFHAAGAGPDGSYGGVMLVHKRAGDFYDVPVANLGLPSPPYETPIQQWLEGADRWARARNYVTAFPTGHSAQVDSEYAERYENEFVCGLYAFKADVADRVTLPWPAGVNLY